VFFPLLVTGYSLLVTGELPPRLIISGARVAGGVCGELRGLGKLTGGVKRRDA